MTKRPLPAWGIQAKKTMIDRGLNMTKLAEEVGMSRTHVSSVVNGRVLSPRAQEVICKHLGIEVPEQIHASNQ